MKIIWHRILIQTLLFQTCLPTRQNGVENRDKAYYIQLKIFCNIFLRIAFWTGDQIITIPVKITIHVIVKKST